MNMINPIQSSAAADNPSPIWHPTSSPNAGALAREILDRKLALNAVILAHNYQVPEIQDVADFVGDSLGLAQQAVTTDAEVIVFCGVHFMAETAKLLNPAKLVILPDRAAGCSLEQSCPADQLRTLEKLHDCMRRLSPRIELPKTTLEQARRPIERMLEISAK